MKNLFFLLLFPIYLFSCSEDTELISEEKTNELELITESAQKEKIIRQCDHTDFLNNLIMGNGNHTLYSDYNNQTKLVLRLYLHSGNYIIEVIDELTNYKRSYEQHAESSSSYTEIPFDSFFDPVNMYPQGKYVTVNVYKPNCENSTNHPCTHFATAKNIRVQHSNSGWYEGFNFQLVQKK